MGDFFQSGVVPTLHNLTRRPLEQIEAELVRFNGVRPMTLTLPSLYSELERPALKRIVDALVEVPYLSEIVIGLDRADESQFRHALEFFAALPQPHRVLWNDGPRLQTIDDQLREQGLAPKELGKGRNVWYCLGYTLARGTAGAVALHDCDIVTYERGMLARLFYPVSNPAFNYEFCKGYYARVTDRRINGRVNRLLVSPLIRALKQIYGAHPYLEFLDSFRYALAGEFSMRMDVISDLRIPSDWGLEIGVLSEMNRNYAANQICQVDIADTYDHKHQPLSEGDPNAGLSRMSTDIAKALFRKLATTGEVFSTETFRSIKASYYRIALDVVEIYYNDAMINGLELDRHEEENTVELFAENIMNAGNFFLENPMETPFIPSWNRVVSAIPDILEQFRDAVELDAQEFGARAQ